MPVANKQTCHNQLCNAYINSVSSSSIL